jgi:hypothetical protein
MAASNKPQVPHRMSNDREKPRPPSLAERIVGLPFTTPLISGAKARLARGGAVELLVPNPAGGRGFYVLDLKATRDFCQLTVHDEMLLENLLSVAAITPAAVRRCARDVAIAGAAGRDAAAAARQAAERDEGIVKLTNYLMLMRLLRSVGIKEDELHRPLGDNKAVQAEIKRRLALLTPEIGLTADVVLDTVADIAFHASAIGFAGSDIRTRHPTILERLRPFAQAITRWSVLENGDSRERAEQIIGCANWTQGEVSPLIVDCQTRLEDIAGLVRAWRHDDAVRERFALPDWLLDGWPEIFGIWDTAAGEDRSVQRAAVAQIHRLLPLAQMIAEKGAVEVLRVESSVMRSRSIKLHEDWKSGIVMSSARTRAEALRAGVA